LAVYPIRVPPLRERRPDIPLLAAHFLDLSRQRLGLGPVRLTDEARERLVGADWPGNVRELENVISRGALRAARQNIEKVGPLLIGAGSLDLERGELSGSAPDPSDATTPRERAAPPPSLAERVEAFRRKEVLAAVARHQGNWAAAARELGLHRSNFHHLAKRLGIRKEQ
jgi:anaerobic nitric oxide reductase transcription regulator